MKRFVPMLRAFLVCVAILFAAFAVFVIVMRHGDRIDPVAGKVVWMRDGEISHLGVASAKDFDGAPAGPFSVILEHVISATANANGTITATYRAPDGSTATFTCDNNGEPLVKD